MPPAIPILDGIAGREDVPIFECGDPLAPLSPLAPSRVRLRPEYYLRGYLSASLECYVRTSVATMVQAAANSLPARIRLLVLDAWRPTSLQAEIYDEYIAVLRNRSPDLSEAQLHTETRRYVSYPTHNPLCPAPHLTGGAVDVTLCDSRGVCLPMGTGFDHFGPEAATRYFEERLSSGTDLAPKELACLGNRRLLFHALAGAGFTNYHEEWWHFDYGNQFWARIMKTTAKYGSINDAPVPSR